MSMAGREGKKTGGWWSKSSRVPGRGTGPKKENAEQREGFWKEQTKGVFFERKGGSLGTYKLYRPSGLLRGTAPGMETDGGQLTAPEGEKKPPNTAASGVVMEKKPQD